MEKKTNYNSSIPLKKKEFQKRQNKSLRETRVIPLLRFFFIKNLNFFLIFLKSAF